MHLTPTITRLLNYTVFTILTVILACLILLTPADAIYQCYVTHRLTNIFIIAGGYIATFLLAALIYATRISTNRNVLQGIPKAWIPIEKEDVGKSVRRLVKGGLARSALVAFLVRPRDVSSNTTAATATGTGVGVGFEDYDGGKEGEERLGLLLREGIPDNDRPPWGRIEHPGWSAPASPDLPPGLCYRTVIQELPHLIEAKAVSLAPLDPVLGARGRGRTGRALYPGEEGEEEEEENAATVPDTRVVEILRRPAAMGLREYMQHLTGLGVIDPPEIGGEFLALYERARFSGRELYEDEFRELMHVFAEVLRGMRFEDVRALGDLDFGLDFAAAASRGNHYAASESLIGPSDEEGETDTLDDVDLDTDLHSLGYQQARRERGRERWPSTPSMQSLRPVRSNVTGSSGSGGSVIRLADARSELPYVFLR